MLTFFRTPPAGLAARRVRPALLFLLVPLWLVLAAAGVAVRRSRPSTVDGRAAEVRPPQGTVRY
ncbi:hypothetical protein ACPPVO_45795 [Dactylosporangium sp. McL0621]|uniref:hypothetical protein n=1 Tax=Dactylosporangium sp. McL0621 TaxID=3415678 RepID=UPI003CF38817